MNLNQKPEVRGANFRIRQIQVFFCKVGKPFIDLSEREKQIFNWNDFRNVNFFLKTALFAVKIRFYGKSN
jgi:hypothetical protein